MLKFTKQDARPYLPDQKAALFPLTQCCGHSLLTMADEIHVLRRQSAVTPCPFLGISLGPFLLGVQSHLSLTFQLRTSKPITNEFPSHSSIPAFDVFNSHLGTIWKMYSCSSDLLNVPSRGKPDWNSIYFCSIFGL